MAEQIENFARENAAASFPPPGTAMSAAEFALLPETMTKVELIDGRVYYPDGVEEVNREIILATPELEHQLASSRLFSLLVSLIPDGIVLHPPVEIDFGIGYKPQPDLLWMAADSSAQRGRFSIIGAPELVVEILSPSTYRHDRVTKFALYEQYGVKEYWIVDLVERSIEVWSHQSTAYRRVGVFFEGDTFASPTIGCDVALTGVFGA